MVLEGAPSGWSLEAAETLGLVNSRVSTLNGGIVLQVEFWTLCKYFGPLK